MSIGIYKIINQIDGKYYVGSSNNIEGNRWPYHKYHLRKGDHYNNHLQNAWNKYGESCFEFVIVNEVLELDLLTE